MLIIPSQFCRESRADKAAAKQCVNVYGAMIWSLAKLHTATNDDAGKAVGEIFADIWRNAEHCDLSMSEECVWIAMIVRQRLKDYSTATASQTSIQTAEKAMQNESGAVSGLSLVIH